MILDLDMSWDRALVPPGYDRPVSDLIEAGAAIPHFIFRGTTPLAVVGKLGGEWAARLRVPAASPTASFPDCAAARAWALDAIAAKPSA